MTVYSLVLIKTVHYSLARLVNTKTHSIKTLPIDEMADILKTSLKLANVKVIVCAYYNYTGSGIILLYVSNNVKHSYNMSMKSNLIKHSWKFSIGRSIEKRSSICQLFYLIVSTVVKKIFQVDKN